MPGSRLRLEPAPPSFEDPPAWIPGYTRPAPPYRAKVQVAIDARGRVTAVRFLESSRADLDYHVRLALPNWRYAPATRNGVALDSVRTVCVEIPPQ